MAKVNFEVLADQVEKRIQELQGSGDNLQPVWQAVGNNIVNLVRLGFRLSKDPWGTAWHPIKWRTPRVQQKGKNKGKLTKYGEKQFSANVAALNGAGSAGQPLVDKGLLRRSVVALATNDGVTIGTNLIQAKVHQFGATIVPKTKKRLVFAGPSGMLIFARRVKVPARPYLPIRPSGTIDLPPLWAKNIIRTLAAHFGLTQQQAVPV